MFAHDFGLGPGMVLIRSDSGQLMLVSQQTLAQAQGQQAQKAISVPAPRLPASRLPSPMVFLFLFLSLLDTEPHLLIQNMEEDLYTPT